MDNIEFIAHVRKENGEWKIHSLEDHLTAVAELTGKFSSKFGAGSFGYLIGLWHDLGKYKEEFQERIGIKSGYDEEAHLEGKTAKSVKHAVSGALLAIEKFQFGAGQFFAFPIAGHHTGLKDLEDLRISLNEEREIQALSTLKESVPVTILNPEIQFSKLNFTDKTLFIRMIFSA
ncbi:MAG TPA: CRISPR-associated endonuclease Cas3'', partial [Leptospiraceae bacterium]|nr:CRISPR-associated endonuclease Cas3'' [Leptospiraceae bacterium]